MKRSAFFLPTLKEDPKEAEIASHKLMLRAGMICQNASGIYSWLPLGAMMLKKIENIIDEEHEKIGAQRIIMPTIQSAHLWKESGRYDAYGKEMLRMKDRHEKDLLYSPTAEEVVTDIARRFVKSYKQLPLVLHQINWKFRDEIRPRFGVMRGREFFMEDAYSFDINPGGAVQTYEKMFNCYLNIFFRIFGQIPDPDNTDRFIRPIPVKADSGPIGGSLSHEFQIMAKTGESSLYYDKDLDALDASNYTYQTIKDKYAANEETFDPDVVKDMRQARGIEVGHVFYLGQKYSKSLNLGVIGQDGKPFFPEMGTYGIGVSRVIAALIEASHDEKGIIWPLSVAPFKVGIVDIVGDGSAEKLYEALRSHGVSVLLDDRKDASIGIKFSEMDLIGIPFQVILGKTFKERGEVDIKNRRTQEMTHEKFLEPALKRILSVL